MQLVNVKHERCEQQRMMAADIEKQQSQLKVESNRLEEIITGSNRELMLPGRVDTLQQRSVTRSSNSRGKITNFRNKTKRREIKVD